MWELRMGLWTVTGDENNRGVDGNNACKQNMKMLQSNMTNETDLVPAESVSEFVRNF